MVEQSRLARLRDRLKHGHTIRNPRQSLHEQHIATDPYGPTVTRGEQLRLPRWLHREVLSSIVRAGILPDRAAGRSERRRRLPHPIRTDRRLWSGPGAIATAAPNARSRTGGPDLARAVLIGAYSAPSGDGLKADGGRHWSGGVRSRGTGRGRWPPPAVDVMSAPRSPTRPARRSLASRVTMSSTPTWLPRAALSTATSSTSPNCPVRVVQMQSKAMPTMRPSRSATMIRVEGDDSTASMRLKVSGAPRLETCGSSVANAAAVFSSAVSSVRAEVFCAPTCLLIPARRPDHPSEQRGQRCLRRSDRRVARSWPHDWAVTRR